MTSQGRRIDLRSEVVTRPTAEMWTAMQEAEIGWPQRGDDENVNELERPPMSLIGTSLGDSLAVAES